MKTINIKGSNYITVNERLKYFRSQDTFAGWRINEEVEILNENEGVFKVTIYDSQGEPMASAHAQEYRDNSYINKTSFLENGFTSALGRALGYLGIGIDTSIASADEVNNAVQNQEKDTRAWLTEEQFLAAMKGSTEQAQNVLKGFKMKKEYRKQLTTKFNL